MFRILLTGRRYFSSGIRTTTGVTIVRSSLRTSTKSAILLVDDDTSSSFNGTEFLSSSSKSSLSLSSHHHYRRYMSSYRYRGDDDDDDDDDSFPKTALVVGSSGSLGRTLCKFLSKELNVQVVGADVVPPHVDDEQNFVMGGFIPLPLPPTTDAEGATHVATTNTSSLSELTMALVDGLSQVLEEDQELDAIISVAGAWEGDPPPVPDDVDILEGAKQYAQTIERMMGKNLYPLLAAGYASHHFMTVRDGLFVAIGATAALSPTPGMLGYGLSKVATHHFVQTLGEMTGKAVTTKARRREVRRLKDEGPSGGSMEYLQRMSVIGILPTTIDTPTNRIAMPQADFNQWTKSIDIAKEIGTWMVQPALRPHSGSLVRVFPNEDGNGATFQLVR